MGKRHARRSFRSGKRGKIVIYCRMSQGRWADGWVGEGQFHDPAPRYSCSPLPLTSRTVVNPAAAEGVFLDWGLTNPAGLSVAVKHIEAILGAAIALLLKLGY